MQVHPKWLSVRRIEANGIQVNVATAGSGPAILLLHGFPHTWELWNRIIPTLSESYFVIAPDIRGHGGSTRAAGGYDLITLTGDVLALLDVLGVEQTDVVAMDIGAPTALYLGLEHPERVRRLVLMEGILGDLLDSAVQARLPWWFGFHGIPGLAEVVLQGHEDEYFGFFLDNGVRSDGLNPELKEQFINAYRGTESMRCGFEYYRNLDINAQLINTSLERSRLIVPTMAVGAFPIGAALFQQLELFTDELRGELIPNCGHAIPLDRPDMLLALLQQFLR